MYTQMEAAVLRAFNPCEVFFCCNEIDFAKIKGKLNLVNSGIDKIKLSSIDKKTELDKLKKDKEDCDKKGVDNKKISVEIKNLSDFVDSLGKIPNRTPVQNDLLAKKQDTLKTRNGGS
jgi:hypothetical protein